MSDTNPTPTTDATEPSTNQGAETAVAFLTGPFPDLAEKADTNTGWAPAERETSIGFAQDQERAAVYCAEKSIVRRLLFHPEFRLEAYQTSHPDRLSQEVSAATLDAEGHDGRKPIYAVRGTIPIGTLTISASPRQYSIHPNVVSKSVTK